MLYHRWRFLEVIWTFACETEGKRGVVESQQQQQRSVSLSLQLVKEMDSLQRALGSAEPGVVITSGPSLTDVSSAQAHKIVKTQLLLPNFTPPSLHPNPAPERLLRHTHTPSRVAFTSIYIHILYGRCGAYGSLSHRGWLNKAFWGSFSRCVTQPRCKRVPCQIKKIKKKKANE